MLANLAMTEAFLISGTKVRQTSPILGERLEIRASFTSSHLPSNASFAIRVSIDGISTERENITYGAGHIDGSWFADILHGFAEGGTKVVTVTLDSRNQIPEDNETDNTTTFSWTPSSTTTLPRKLAPFVAGTAGVDWRITNFADLDPRPGILRDYRGGQFTYDAEFGGHAAIDLGPGVFSGMDAGMPVLAAAAGTVTEIRDGEFDRQTSFSTSDVPANYVVIDLGNGWRTLYWHMRRDSVSVRVGDKVQVGDFLGFAGSSGFSTGPHVHFELQYLEHSVETMLDAGTFWLTPPAYPSDYRHAIKSGFSSLAPTDSEWAEEPETMSTFKRGDRVHFWVVAGAMLPHDTRTIRFLRPDGSTYFEQIDNQGATFYASSQWYYYVTLPSDAPTGLWSVSWLQNNLELARRNFTVSLTGVPEIRVEQGGEYLRNRRFTPIDFGSSAVGTAGKTVSLTVANQGSAPLTLGTISLPEGFQLAAIPDRFIPAGGSTTLSVQLRTVAAGCYSGELRLATNDPDESTFSFWLEGLVLTTGTESLITGISVRKAAEGERFIANIRRTGNITSPLTVALQSDSSELQIPAAVVIPPGSDIVNFEVRAVQDFSSDGSQRVALTASANGFSPGRNEIVIENSDVGEILVTQSGGSTSISETGTIDQISVSLSIQPLTNVVVRLFGTDNGEAVPVTSSLTFTPANWATPQTVDIRGIDDSLIDGTQQTSIRIHVEDGLSDRRYQDTLDVVITASTSDDDLAGFEILQSGGSSVTREQTVSDTILVRLQAQPRSNVVIAVTNPNPGELTVDQSTLSFTPSLWNAWKTIRLAAVDDGVVDGDQTTQLTLFVVDSDSDHDFDTVSNQQINVVSQDNRPDFQVFESGEQTSVHEDNPADSIQITLTMPPSSPVIVLLQPAIGAELSLDQTRLTFNADNWSIPQAVVITALDDLIEEPAEVHELRIHVDVVNSDAGFAASVPRNVSVTVIDDEPLPPSVVMPLTATINQAVTFSWNAVDSATNYELWVNFVSGNADKIVYQNLNTTSLTCAGFGDMGIYRVWVRATVGSGFKTRWSSPRDLNVLQSPTIQPVARYVDTARPAFNWSIVATATRYEIWLENVLQKSVVVRRSDLTTTNYSVPFDLTMSLYRLWVRAFDQRGISTPWSVRQEFFVTPRASLEATVLSTFDRTPSLRWQSVLGARSYEVWVRNEATGTDLHRVSGIQGTEWTVPTDLGVGRYRWWVRASGGHGINGLWSHPRSLSVGGQIVMQTPFV
ncbi:MAG: peptidoglycan DD-metalloendopeptidase family protein, partial [Planctomycetota bacterium]